MGIKQYNIGKDWEDAILQYYKDHGYATFKLPTDIVGTVFDIIAIKNNRCECIECKHTMTDKLYYKKSGLYGKRDELDNFEKCGNRVVLWIMSEKCGEFLIFWSEAKTYFEKKGYLDMTDCYRWRVEDETR